MTISRNFGQESEAMPHKQGVARDADEAAA